MNNTIKTLLIDLNEGTSVVIADILEEIEEISVECESQSFDKGYRQIREIRPEIIVLHLYPSPEEALMFARKISTLEPDIALIILSQDQNAQTVIKAMRAGAQEFLPLPVVKEDLQNAIHQTIVKYRYKKGKGSEGKIISFFGAKGGVGTTTLTVNAGTSLAHYSNKSVLLLDLNLQFGQMALFLNLKKSCPLNEILPLLDNLDPAMLMKPLAVPREGVSLIANPTPVEAADAVTPAQIEQLLFLLKEVYDYILVDTGPVIDDVTLRALDTSDHIILVSGLEIPVVYNTRRCLALFEKIGYSKDKVRLVVNRHSSFDDFEFGPLDKVYDYDVHACIPNHDRKSMCDTLYKGVSLSRLEPKAKFSQNVTKMIRSFNGSIHLDPKKGKKVRYSKPLINN